MARISASIPEDLKDELYQAATDENQAISHIIVEALRAHFGRSRPSAGATKSVVSEPLTGLQDQLAQLTLEVRELRETLGTRTPPRGARYF